MFQARLIFPFEKNKKHEMNFYNEHWMFEGEGKKT